MTHHEYLGVSVVLNELEVVACLPIVLFLVNENVFEVLLCHLDHTGLVLHVMLHVSHREMVEHFDLVELVSQVLRELDLTNTVAVYAEGQVLLQPSEGLWLPFHVDIEPVVAFLSVWHLNIGVTVLSSDLGIDKGRSVQTVCLVLSHQVGNAVSILIVSSSW